MRRRERGGALSEMLQTVGSRLREMRVTANFTQEQVAWELEVSVQAVRNWEVGRHEPTTIHLYGMAELCGVSARDIQETLFGSGVLRPMMSSGAPIKGYLLAGSVEHREPVEGIPLPDFILREHPNVFGLVVAGHSLVGANGIHDGDVVLVDPDSLIEEDGVHVFQVRDEIFARSIEIHAGRVRLMGINKNEAELFANEVGHIGKVVWHLKRM